MIRHIALRRAILSDSGPRTRAWYPHASLGSTAGPGVTTLAEIKDFTDRFNTVYEANDWKAYWGFYADDMTQVVHLHDSPAPDDAQKK